MSNEFLKLQKFFCFFLLLSAEICEKWFISIYGFYRVWYVRRPFVPESSEPPPSCPADFCPSPRHFPLPLKPSTLLSCFHTGCPTSCKRKEEGLLVVQHAIYKPHQSSVFLSKLTQWQRDRLCLKTHRATTAQSPKNKAKKKTQSVWDPLQIGEDLNSCHQFSWASCMWFSEDSADSHLLQDYRRSSCRDMKNLI